MYRSIKEKILHSSTLTLRLFLLLVALLPILSGCSSINGTYPIVLKEVLCNFKSEGKIEKVKIGDEFVSLYSDQFISTSWEFKEQEIIVKIGNLSNKPLTLNWNYIFHIDRHNDETSSMRSSIPFRETNEIKTPIDLIPNQNIQLTLEKLYIGWQEDLSLMPSSHSDKEEIQEFNNEYNYRKIRVSLPFQIESRKLEYLFTFDVKDFIIKEENKNSN